MERVKTMMKTVVHFFLDIIETIVVALALFVIIYLFLVQPHQINGNSMYPSFFDGEYLLTDKLSYRFKDPQRGDVIIFHAPAGARCPKELQCDFVKRIIGLSRETIEIKEGKIYINGSLIEESYVQTNDEVINREVKTELQFVLKEDEYFVMGDNRSHSSDSRAWGSVPKENIVGRAWIRYWPLKRAGIIAEASY